MSHTYFNNQSEKYYHRQSDLLEDLETLAKSDTYVFRGYNKQDQLLPNIIRDSNYSNYEVELLETFEKHGCHYFIATTPIDFLSYGQHYGLPTRLLDFTYNPFIALRFSLFSQKSFGSYAESDDKEYYYIRYCNIKDNICLKGIPVYNPFTFGNFELDSIARRTSTYLHYFSSCLNDPTNNLFNDYLKGLCECNADSITIKNKCAEDINRKIISRKLCFIDPNQSNQRIIMQQGLFMLPYILSANEHLALIHNNTSVIKIHKSLRDSLLKYLDTLGYNTFRLMPDLPSICTAVTQKIKDKRT